MANFPSAETKTEPQAMADRWQYCSLYTEYHEFYSEYLVVVNYGQANSFNPKSPESAVIQVLMDDDHQPFENLIAALNFMARSGWRLKALGPAKEFVLERVTPSTEE